MHKIVHDNFTKFLHMRNPYIKICVILQFKRKCTDEKKRFDFRQKAIAPNFIRIGDTCYAIPV
jgi:hypothetical protein